MEEPKLFTPLRKYALILGTGGVAALQIMKWELLVLPDLWKLNLSYFFSVVVIFCVFLGGFSLLKTIQEGQNIIGNLNNIKEKEEEKNRVIEDNKVNRRSKPKS